LKRGLIAYKAQALEDSTSTPYDVYRQLDLGEGGYVVTPASRAKAEVGAIIQRKHGG